MSRVKRGKIAHKKREKILKQTKGFRWGRKSKERLAKEALLHAWTHAFVGRKQKKRDFRSLWQAKIGAGTREMGMAYSRFMAALKKENVALNRKVLSEIAEEKPEVFKNLVEQMKSSSQK